MGDERHPPSVQESAWGLAEDLGAVMLGLAHLWRRMNELEGGPHAARADAACGRATKALHKAWEAMALVMAHAEAAGPVDTREPKDEGPDEPSGF